MSSYQELHDLLSRRSTSKEDQAEFLSHYLVKVDKELGELLLIEMMSEIPDEDIEEEFYDRELEPNYYNEDKLSLTQLTELEEFLEKLHG